jgi:orotate phosphoribosyltransferase
MRPHQAALTTLLIEASVLRFGEFTLKSGRRSPVFVDAGRLRTGELLRRAGEAYAAHALEAIGPGGIDLVFGPSYKGVPLAVATAMGWATLDRDVPFAFDRKEAKDHGEGGVFVGAAPRDGMRVLVVDDVITSGQSIREAVALLRASAAVTIAGVVVAVDRQERGSTASSDRRTTTATLRAELGVPVLPILELRTVAHHLHHTAALDPHDPGGGRLVDDARLAALQGYWSEHGGDLDGDAAPRPDGGVTPH